MAVKFNKYGHKWPFTGGVNAALPALDWWVLTQFVDQSTINPLNHLNLFLHQKLPVSMTIEQLKELKDKLAVLRRYL